MLSISAIQLLVEKNDSITIMNTIVLNGTSLMYFDTSRIPTILYNNTTTETKKLTTEIVSITEKINFINNFIRQSF